MDKNYMVVLWNDELEKTVKHDITFHETLRDAVTYLASKGGLYEHQEIVQKVDWMPKEDKVATAAPTHKMTPEEEALAKRPNPTTPPPEQPVTIDPLHGTNLAGKKSIFDGIIPQQMRNAIAKDD
jgi:hypothetical protein